MSFAKLAEFGRSLLQRLDLIYFVLAGIDLLTIITALSLNNLTLNAFEDGVHISATWSQRQADIIHLSRLAKEANAPGNEVFFTRKPERERAAFAAALARFGDERERVAAAIAANPISRRDAGVLQHIALVQTAVDEMSEQTEYVFREFARGDMRDAGRNMAMLDRTFHVLLGRLDDALATVEAGRAEHLESQLARAQSMRALEFIVAAAVLVIVLLVAAYGAHMGRSIRANVAQRAEMLNTVAAARDRLRYYADDVSHELRGPISKIRLDAEVLLQRTRTPAQYRDGLESILLEAERLSAIVESLLFLARAEKTEIAVEPAPLDARRELELLVEFFAAAAEKRGVALQLDAPKGVTLWADRVLLQRAVSNLISNALNHAAGSKHVRVSARAERDATLIVVADDGPGMSPEQLSRAFDRFQRASTSQGLGLGLAITKGIMDIHSGGIELVAPPEGGFVVQVRFPVLRHRQAENNSAVITL